MRAKGLSEAPQERSFYQPNTGQCSRVQPLLLYLGGLCPFQFRLGDDDLRCPVLFTDIMLHVLAFAGHLFFLLSLVQIKAGNTGVMLRNTNADSNLNLKKFKKESNRLF